MCMYLCVIKSEAFSWGVLINALMWHLIKKLGKTYPLPNLINVVIKLFDTLFVGLHFVYNAVPNVYTQTHIQTEYLRATVTTM